MNEINLMRVDLNLMKVFDAVMRSRSVTGAAHHLAIGQPAASHALARLRATFGDELFVKTPNGMQPTRRAEVLIVPVRRALAEIAHALNSAEDFDPGQSSFQISLGMSDYTEAILLPPLIEGLAEAAPGLTLRIVQIELGNVLKMLDDRRIDIAVGQIDGTSAWHRREVLFHDTRKCLYAPRLIDAAPPIGMERYLAHNHIVRSLGGHTSSVVDQALAAQGRTRRVSMASPRFSSLPGILTRTPVIATLPASLARLFAATADLVVSDTPFAVPGIDIAMLWHAVTERDPPQAWIRDRLRYAACHGSSLPTLE